MDYLNYVNIKQGTRSNPRFSNGNTLPLTQLPFAMASFTVQTDGSRESWFYHPDDKSIEGVRLTHQPSPWIGDYGALLMLVQSGICGTDYRSIWSGFDQTKATLTPNFLSVRFIKSNASLSLAPTQTGASMQLIFDDYRTPYFTLMSLGGKSKFSYDKDTGKLTGYTENIHRMPKAGFRMYFIYQFDTDDVDVSDILISKTPRSLEKGVSVEGDKISIHIAFKNNIVNLSMCTSYISYEQAELNLSRELKNLSLKEVSDSAAFIWQEHLSRIEVKTNSIKQMKTFYSCLYRCFLFPHKCYELDINEKPIHFSPYDGKIHDGVRYTDSGFWDTFRTLFPLFSIIAKEEYKSMLEGFVNDYIESGWLPRWPSMVEVGCMPSTLIDAVIADAAVKNIADRPLLEKALEGMIKHANVKSDDKKHGRNGVEDYIKLGYVPYEDESESVNLTLDAAYGDFCISVVADKLGKDELKEEYLNRSKNYIHLFDKSTGFMRAKDRNGQFRPDFNKFMWGRDYTEGCAWQNSFSVYHDLENFAKLYGEDADFIRMITEIFVTPPLYYTDNYGREIHEMTEMASADFGQCAISNQPSFHIPYLFSYFGMQHRTDYWVERICNEVFSEDESGFPGDEDNGATSSWYIFSSLGLYPICPGKAEYIKGPMLVKSAKILGNKWSNKGFTKIIPHDVLS